MNQSVKNDVRAARGPDDDLHALHEIGPAGAKRRGYILASKSSHRDTGRESRRWTEVTVYKLIDQTNDVDRHPGTAAREPKYAVSHVGHSIVIRPDGTPERKLESFFLVRDRNEAAEALKVQNGNRQGSITYIAVSALDAASVVDQGFAGSDMSHRETNVENTLHASDEYTIGGYKSAAIRFHGYALADETSEVQAGSSSQFGIRVFECMMDEVTRYLVERRSWRVGNNTIYDLTSQAIMANDVDGIVCALKRPGYAWLEKIGSRALRAIAEKRAELKTEINQRLESLERGGTSERELGLVPGSERRRFLEFFESGLVLLATGRPHYEIIHWERTTESATLPKHALIRRMDTQFLLSRSPTASRHNGRIIYRYMISEFGRRALTYARSQYATSFPQKKRHDGIAHE